jgi:hypothetical protein
VVDTGIEPVTPSMSRKCATAAPIDRVSLQTVLKLEVETGFEPVVLQLCRLLLWAAQPLHHSNQKPKYLITWGLRPLRADDEIRTRDPNLGKVVLYQLSHIRVSYFQDLDTLTQKLGYLQLSAPLPTRVAAGVSQFTVLDQVHAGDFIHASNAEANCFLNPRSQKP